MTSSGTPHQEGSLFTNLSYSMLSQMLTLITNALFIVFLPKVLSVADFGYWQLFLFYASFIGVAHLGLQDGLVLKIGGQTDKTVNKRMIWSIFLFSTALIAILATVVLGSAFFESDASRQFVLILLAAEIIIGNIQGFFYATLTAIGRAREYAVSIFAEKTFLLISASILWYMDLQTFHLYAIAFILAKIISVSYLFLRHAKLIFHRPPTPASKFVPYSKELVQIGYNVLLANLASMLIIGMTRFFVEWGWGIATFSKVSLSISVVSLFLASVNQIAPVAFPALRRLTPDILWKRLPQINISITALMLVATTLLPLLHVAISWWLPQYRDSLSYLYLMAPLIIYTTRMQVVYSSYFRVLRLERRLLGVNVIAVGISLIGCYLSVWFQLGVTAIVASGVIATVIRTLISARLLLGSRYSRLDFFAEEGYLLILVLLFLLAATGPHPVPFGTLLSVLMIGWFYWHRGPLILAGAALVRKTRRNG